MARYYSSYVMLAVFTAQPTLSRDVFAYTSMRGLGSVASSYIRVEKPTALRINGIQDMIVGLNPLGNEIVWVNTLCVASTQPSGSYAIKAMGSSNADGAFALSHERSRLTYKVEWSTEGRGHAYQRAVLQSGSAHAVSGGAVSDYNLCKGKYSNARLVITIPSGNVPSSARAGYAETLTLMVSAH